MKINYFCCVPDNKQPFLIFDELRIENYIASYDEGDINQWHVTFLNCGDVVLQTITPCHSFSQCLQFIAGVVDGIPLDVGKCGKP